MQALGGFLVWEPNQFRRRRMVLRSSEKALKRKAPEAFRGDNGNTHGEGQVGCRPDSMLQAYYPINEYRHE